MALLRRLVVLAVLGMAQTGSAWAGDGAFSYEQVTCGDMVQAFADARGGAGSAPEDVKDARKDVLYGLTWMDGYIRGAKLPIGDGITFDLDGAKLLVDRLEKACAGKPDDELVIKAVEAKP
jgi:hypothetical protein